MTCRLSLSKYVECEKAEVRRKSRDIPALEIKYPQRHTSFVILFFLGGRKSWEDDGLFYTHSDMFRPVCCRERTSTCVCLSLFGRPETRLLMSSDKDEKGFFEPPIFKQDCGGPADTYEFIFLLSHPPLFYFLCFLAAIISVQTAGVKLRSSDTYNSWVQIFFESAFIQAVVYYSHPLEKETHRLFIYTFLLCMNVSPDRWSINIMELHKQSTGKGGPFFSSSFAV